jgi:hypothetical protein
MKALLKTAINEKQRNITNIVIRNRASDNDDTVFMILSTINWQLGTAPKPEDKIFFNSLFSLYINYRLKQLRIKLGDVLANSPDNFDKMKELVNTCLQQMERAHKYGMINEPSIVAVRGFCTGTLTSIEQKKIKAKETLEFSLSLAEPEELSAPTLQVNKTALFYLKDASAKKFLENAKKATVTESGENVIVKGTFNLEADVGFKLKAKK